MTSSAWLLRPPREKATKGLGKTAHTAETVMKRKEGRKRKKKRRKVGNVGTELGMNRARKEGRKEGRK